jgi:hypothetical protein
MKRSGVVLAFFPASGGLYEVSLSISPAVWAAAQQLAGRAGFRFRGHLADGQEARFAKALPRGLADIDQRPGGRRLR